MKPSWSLCRLISQYGAAPLPRWHNHHTPKASYRNLETGEVPVKAKVRDVSADGNAINQLQMIARLPIVRGKRNPMAPSLASTAPHVCCRAAKR